MRLLAVLCIVAAAAVGGCCNAIYAAIMSNGNDDVAGYWANPINQPETMKYGTMIYNHDQARDQKNGNTIWYSCDRKNNSLGPVYLGTCKKVDDTHYEVTETYAYHWDDDDWHRISTPRPIRYELVKRNNGSYLYYAGQAHWIAESSPRTMRISGWAIRITRDQ